MPIAGQIERPSLTVISDIGQVLTEDTIKASVDVRLVIRERLKQKRQEQATNPKARYVRIAKDAEGLTDAFSRLTPSANSKTGFNAIANSYPFGGYYTVRPDLARQVGVDWLSKHGFPEPEKVHICKDHKDKMRRIVNDFILNPDAENNSYVALIDDNFGPLLHAASQLIDEGEMTRDATQRVILVGFGRSADKIQNGGFDVRTGIRIFSLSSWESQNVNGLIEDINSIYVK